MNEKEFFKRNNLFVKKMKKDSKLEKLTNQWFNQASKYEYSYHFKWLGRPIIQFPQDIIALQEIIWQTKPDLIIETGIARGGSLIFFASILEMIGKGRVLGVDIDIRKENRKMIEKHHMYKRIKMIEGSSVDEKVIQQVYKLSKEKKNIMVVLDSNHTHNHVKAELEAYSPLVKKGNFLAVMDTIIESMSNVLVKNKPWKKGNNAKSAVIEFLENNKRFEIDNEYDSKLLITVAPSGYLKCIKN